MSSDTPTDVQDGGNGLPKFEPPPLLTKIRYASLVFLMKAFEGSISWFRQLKDPFIPTEVTPDLVKAIFLPTSYDPTQLRMLPTLFTIHGGGFVIGHARTDDEWNRAFADGQDTMVVALNYSKAPEIPFSTAVHDLEALLHAVLDDKSLPIDCEISPRSSTAEHSSSRSRTAILGFSAGGNLSLCVSQLLSVRSPPHGSPAAAVSVYEMSVRPQDKLPNRPWKPSFPPPRNGTAEPLMAFALAFEWAYIPCGQDLCDPLLSLHFAPREKLPPFVGIVAAELDMMTHEAWRLASRLAGEGVVNESKTLRKILNRSSEDPKWRICGREQPSEHVGGLEGLSPADNWDAGGVKWLLVPDVMYGFDNRGFRTFFGGKESNEYAEVKGKACQAEIVRWLRETVWCS
ncbi:alpha/beta hydrolase fold-domain-containing protein [Apodospora peruviana]|uniref:Alpha/beta hydrolase fold-domain-containing protein n=1 Tax=Apodospora peruviana TaxID=516989 RepID=A0AAE0HUB6_9PEZI|nr:alpha/beta hydrolase fold-domain-containing protein [Apodospora peruviana]